jgi:hypothetical protein
MPNPGRWPRRPPGRDPTASPAPVSRVATATGNHMRYITSPSRSNSWERHAAGSGTEEPHDHKKMNLMTHSVARQAPGQ